jgi:hypothetical protein
MHYRVYELNSNTGRIMQGHDIAAETDAQAIAAAHRIHPRGPFELWCQSRRVFSRAGGEAERSA